MIKLHVGCGKRKIYGWTNVDADLATNPDVLDKAEVLKDFADNSVSVIYACHILEHFKRNEVSNVLKTWFNKLEPQGVLRIAVPDFEKVVEAYGEFPLPKLLGFLVGGQRNEYDIHYMVFDFETLSNHLKAAGFVNIKRYKWEETEHFFVDDYSSCYLPHMDKGSGMLMSLNVECEKP